MRKYSDPAIAITIAAALALAGCSDPVPEPDPEPLPDPQASALRDTIQAPIDKAKQVETDQAESDAERRKALDEAGG